MTKCCGYTVLGCVVYLQALTGGERVELRTPVREAGYTTHPGAVFGMDCSPFQVRHCPNG